MTPKISKITESGEVTCRQWVIIAILLMLDVKGVEYQYNFSPCWRNDQVLSGFIVLVIIRIVRRNDRVDNVRENFCAWIIILEWPLIYNHQQTAMFQIRFIPADAMLARVLAMALCPSVSVSVCICLSQVGVLSKRMNESSWFLARELLSTSALGVLNDYALYKSAHSLTHSTYPTLCYKKNRVSPSRTLPRSLDLWNFATISRSSKYYYQLSSTKLDAEIVINWTIAGHLSWQYLRATTLDRCGLTQWSSSSVYSKILSRGFISYNWYCR